MAQHQNTPKIHLRAVVSLDDHEFVPGSEGYCPIANKLKDDPDILAPRVTDKIITFSRRSTEQRYWYRTPQNAVRFIHAVDAILETKEVPTKFTLILTEADLIKVKDRTVSDAQNRVRQANTRDDVVHVQKGKIVVEPRREAEHRGRRPKRVNEEADELLASA